MNQVDQGGSSAGLPPEPTSTGYFTYVNGQKVWVPKTVTVPKPVAAPPKPVTLPPKPATTPVTQTTDTGTSGVFPPPPAAKPLEMTDYAAFERQDSATHSQSVKPPVGYTQGQKPTQEELDKILEDLRRHAEDQWKYAGPIEAGITPADAARIKGQIPFSQVLPVNAPKIDFYSGVDVTTGQPYGVTQAAATSPTGPTTYTEPTAPEESGDLSLEQPTLPDITWEEKYHVEGAPDWWRGMIPDRYDAQSEYASMLNSMIPFMSPEDQRYAASFLFRLYPQYFSSYSSFASSETIPQAPTELTTDQRQYMTSYQRAQSILDTLEKVKQISGNPKLGPGYAYLQELGSVLRDYGAKGTGNSQTRQQYQQMMGALDPLVAENQQENLSAYSALTRMLTQPYYTAGQIHPTTTLQDNSVISGTPIKNYF